MNNTTIDNPALQYADEHADTFKAHFIDLLTIKSISTDPAFAHEVQHAADWIAARMEAIGLQSQQFKLPEGRHPVVMGQYTDAGSTAPTVLIYCHYDVQPAVIADGWHSPPFEPVERESKLFARGATDSKVHVMAWLSAVESLIATDSCAVNIKLLFEGEEESGGKTVSALIQQQPNLVQADIAIISDGIIRSPEQPALIYGLRGIVTLEVHVQAAQTDLHSGHFGGTVHNPAQALSEIIAALHDENGRVTIPNFYDEVQALDAAERERLAASNDAIQHEWDTIANAPQAWGEAEFTLHERVGARPTLEINGISGGYTGDGFKTVLPATAFAKISCRLVPQQDPQTILERVQGYIREITPPTVRVSFMHTESEAPPVYIDPDSPTMQAAFRAYEKGWGVAPVYERAGGSVPITYEVMQITPNIAIMGFSYKGGRAHGPDENIPLAMFYRGINTAIHLLQDATYLRKSS